MSQKPIAPAFSTRLRRHRYPSNVFLYIGIAALVSFILLLIIRYPSRSHNMDSRVNHSLRSQMTAGVSVLYRGHKAKGGTIHGGGYSQVEGRPEVWALGPKGEGSTDNGRLAGTLEGSRAAVGASGNLMELVGEGNMAKLKAMCGRCVAWGYMHRGLTR